MFVSARSGLADADSPVTEQAVTRTPLPRGAVREVLEHRPEAASAARRFAKAVMDQWQVGLDPTEGIVLAVSELVTNAVEHANPPLALHLHREAQGGAIWVGVTDGGCTESEGAWTASRAADEHGRGLTIIDALAVAHGVHTHDNGTTTHWARLPA